MEYINQIIALICITILWITAEPAVRLKRILFKEENYEKYTDWVQFIHRILYCAECSGFWIGFIFTHSIWQAAIVAIGSELIYRIMNRLV